MLGRSARRWHSIYQWGLRLWCGRHRFAHKKSWSDCDQYDVLGIVGNGATFDILMEAGDKWSGYHYRWQDGWVEYLGLSRWRKRWGRKILSLVYGIGVSKTTLLYARYLGLTMIINPWTGGGKRDSTDAYYFLLPFKIGYFCKWKNWISFEFRLKENARLIDVPLNRFV